jgi:hypothetical protein
MQIKAPISPKGQDLIAWARIRNVTLTHLSAAEAGVVSLATGNNNDHARLSGLCSPMQRSPHSSLDLLVNNYAPPITKTVSQISEYGIATWG